MEQNIHDSRPSGRLTTAATPAAVQKSKIVGRDVRSADTAEPEHRPLARLGAVLFCSSRREEAQTSFPEFPMESPYVGCYGSEAQPDFFACLTYFAVQSRFKSKVSEGESNPVKVIPGLCVLGVFGVRLILVNNPEFRFFTHHVHPVSVLFPYFAKTPRKTAKVKTSQAG